MGTGKLTVCGCVCVCGGVGLSPSMDTSGWQYNGCKSEHSECSVPQIHCRAALPPNCLSLCLCVLSCVVQGNGAAGLPEVSCQDMSRHCHSIGSSPLCLASQPVGLTWHLLKNPTSVKIGIPDCQKVFSLSLSYQHFFKWTNSGCCRHDRIDAGFKNHRWDTSMFTNLPDNGRKSSWLRAHVRW